MSTKVTVHLISTLSTAPLVVRGKTGSITVNKAMVLKGQSFLTGNTVF